MREIKVRCFNTETNKMCDAETLNQLCRSYHDNGVAEGMVGMPQIGVDNEGELCGHLIWLEWTGLKDKNGKEIYEGDRLYYAGLNGTVVYDENTCSFKVKSDGIQRVKFQPLTKMVRQQLKVIGNIYEQEEFIKPK